MSPTKQWYEKLPIPVWLAIIGALSSLLLGVVNRVSPAEDLARKTYEAESREIARQGRALERVTFRLARLEGAFLGPAPGARLEPKEIATSIGPGEPEVSGARVRSFSMASVAPLQPVHTLAHDSSPDAGIADGVREPDTGTLQETPFQAKPLPSIDSY